MSIHTVPVARSLPTSFAGDTPVAGFTLTEVEGGWEVNDGRDATVCDTPAEALRTYAEFIETFIDDQGEATRTVWQVEIDRARADAEAVA